MNDRISELPDCVLGHILCFLDTKWAVSTTILSKRWKNLIWNSLFNLHFDENSFPSHSWFRKTVMEVLARREARDRKLPVDKLIFITKSKSSSWFSDYVLDYAMSRGLQHLQLSDDFSVVDRLLISQVLPISLKILKLSAAYASIETLLCLPRLEILHLEKFWLGLNLLSECGNLVELSIVDCKVSSPEPEEEFRICAPRLLSLRISHLYSCNRYTFRYTRNPPKVVLVLPKLTSFKVKAYSSEIPVIETDEFFHLKTAKVKIRNKIKEHESMINILQKLCYARHVTLNLPAFELLLNIGGPLGVPLSPFLNLKTFSMTTEEASAESGFRETMSMSFINQVLNTVFQSSSPVEVFIEFPRPSKRARKIRVSLD